MYFKKDIFNVVSIPTDGNCLFRCLVTFLDNTLMREKRNKNGYILNNESKMYEQHSTQFLRNSVVGVIEDKKIKYSTELYYDNELYNSIENRIENMYNSGEFAGKLEIDTLANMYSLNIVIVIENKDKYNIIYNSTQTDTLMDESENFDIIDKEDCTDLSRTRTRTRTRTRLKNRNSIEESDDEEYNITYENHCSNIDLRKDCVLLLTQNHYEVLSVDSDYLDVIDL